MWLDLAFGPSLSLGKSRGKAQGEQQILWPKLAAESHCEDVFPHKTEVLPYNPSVSVQLSFQEKTVL